MHTLSGMKMRRSQWARHGRSTTVVTHAVTGQFIAYKQLGYHFMIGWIGGGMYGLHPGLETLDMEPEPDPGCLE